MNKDNLIKTALSNPSFFSNVQNKKDLEDRLETIKKFSEKNDVLDPNQGM